jgi:hypothetical protein
MGALPWFHQMWFLQIQSFLLLRPRLLLLTSTTTTTIVPAMAV